MAKNTGSNIARAFSYMHFGSWRARRYFPENAAYFVLFKEMVSVD
jgi:hypothetical protein